MIFSPDVFMDGLRGHSLSLAHRDLSLLHTQHDHSLLHTQHDHSLLYTQHDHSLFIRMVWKERMAIK